mmetsp:Transcript_11784/g.33177  ORF Transcript_11784/g.33177 Transcript_11784/m.33177 type:complete len:299 (+) Transcript_11784:25-921(+)
MPGSRTSGLRYKKVEFTPSGESRMSSVTEKNGGSIVQNICAISNSLLKSLLSTKALSEMGSWADTKGASIGSTWIKGIGSSTSSMTISIVSMRSPWMAVRLKIYSPTWNWRLGLLKLSLTCCDEVTEQNPPNGKFVLSHSRPTLGNEFFLQHHRYWISPPSSGSMVQEASITNSSSCEIRRTGPSCEQMRNGADRTSARTLSLPTRDKSPDAMKSSKPTLQVNSYVRPTSSESFSIQRRGSGTSKSRSSSSRRLASSTVTLTRSWPPTTVTFQRYSSGSTRLSRSQTLCASQSRCSSE